MTNKRLATVLSNAGWDKDTVNFFVESVAIDCRGFNNTTHIEAVAGFEVIVQRKFGGKSETIPLQEYAVEFRGDEKKLPIAYDFDGDILFYHNP